MSRRPTTRAELRLLGYAPMQLMAAEQGSITLLGQTHADGTEASYAMKKDFNALAFVKEAVT